MPEGQESDRLEGSSLSHSLPRSSPPSVPGQGVEEQALGHHQHWAGYLRRRKVLACLQVLNQEMQTAARETAANLLTHSSPQHRHWLQQRHAGGEGTPHNFPLHSDSGCWKTGRARGSPACFLQILTRTLFWDSTRWCSFTDCCEQGRRQRAR